MNYELTCHDCKAVGWCHGHVESDTNALCLNEDEHVEWEGGDENCEHSDFEVTDSEFDSDET